MEDPVFKLRPIIGKIKHSSCRTEVSIYLPANLLHREGDGTPLQYSCLENPMHRRAWKAAVHRVAKNQTRLSDFTFTFHFLHAGALGWRPVLVSSLMGPWSRSHGDVLLRCNRHSLLAASECLSCVLGSGAPPGRCLEILPYLLVCLFAIHSSPRTQ